MGRLLVNLPGLAMLFAEVTPSGLLVWLRASSQSCACRMADGLCKQLKVCLLQRVALPVTQLHEQRKGPIVVPLEHVQRCLHKVGGMRTIQMRHL